MEQQEQNLFLQNASKYSQIKKFREIKNMLIKSHWILKASDHTTTIIIISYYLPVLKIINHMFWNIRAPNELNMKTKFWITKRKVWVMLIWWNGCNSIFTRVQVVQECQVQLTYTWVTNEYKVVVLSPERKIP